MGGSIIGLTREIFFSHACSRRQKPEEETPGAQSLTGNTPMDAKYLYPYFVLSQTLDPKTPKSVNPLIMSKPYFVPYRP